LDCPTTFAQSDTFAVVSPWVVAVIQPDGKYVDLGSGFVSTTGYVITAAHVIASAKAPVYLAAQGNLTPDRLRTAKVVSYDRDSDIAVLDGGYAPPGGLLAQQTAAETGDEVWIFGYEFIDSGRAAVLRIARGSLGQKFEGWRFQLDGPVQHGFSGGPITTRGGRVVGIVDFGFNGKQPNLSYIVPNKLIQSKLSTLRQPARVSASNAGIIPPLPQTAPTPQATVRDTLVVPGQRLGPVTLAMPLPQMDAILGGSPDITSDSTTGHIYTWKLYGVIAAFDMKGAPIMVASWNPAFNTSEGIRVGAAVDAVERAYGLNYQTSWSQDQQSFIVGYPSGLAFVVSATTRTVTAVAIARPLTTAPSPTPLGGSGSGLSGTYAGNYIATVQPNALYHAVFQMTQNGSTVVGSVTSTAGRSGRISGVITGTRIDATLTFTDSCGGRATAVIDIINGGHQLVGNYTAVDCLGTYSGNFVLTRQ
jgi:hypothetical protein